MITPLRRFSLGLGVVLQLALVSAVPSQLTLEVVAAEDLLVIETQAWGSPKVIKKIAKDTRLPNGADLTWMVIKHSIQSGVITYEFVGYAMTSTFTWRRIEGAVFLWLKSQKPLEGRLTVRYEQVSPNMYYTATVDHSVFSSATPPILLVNPGRTVVRSHRVTLDAGGIQVGHRANARFGGAAYGSPTIKTRLLIEFRPDVWTENYGKSCGPTLSTSTNSATQIEFILGNLPRAPHGLAALFFGTKELNVQIPGTSCFVYNDYLLGVLRTSNSTGTAKIILNRPSSPIRVNVQAVGLDTRTQSLGFSQGLRVFFR